MSENDIKSELAYLAEFVRQHNWSAPQVRLGQRASFRCEYCDRDLLASIDEYDAWEIDHIDPARTGAPSDDPTDSLSNFAVACRLCNKIKQRWCPDGGWRECQSREERLELIRRYIFEKRMSKQVRLIEMRRLIRQHSPAA